MKKTNTIILVDPMHGGHHDLYISLYSNVLQKMGFNIFTIRGPINYGIYNLTSKLPIVGSIIRTVKLWYVARNKVEEIFNKDGGEPSLVMFLWIDSYLSPYLSPKLVDKIFPYDWFGLYFYPAHFRVKAKYNPFVNKLDKDRVLSSVNCKRVGVLDKNIVDNLKEKIGDKVISFPDVTNTETIKNSKLAETILNKAAGRDIVGLIGSLDRRKGVITLLTLAEKTENKKMFFVLAGKLSTNTFTETEQKYIQKMITNLKNCYFYLKRIKSEEEFNSVLKICDVVYLLYKNFPHSSNLLTKASFFGKPVVVSKGFYMEEVVKKYNLGLVIGQDDINELYLGIKKLIKNKLDNKSSYNYYKDNSLVCLEQTLKHVVNTKQ